MFVGTGRSNFQIARLPEMERSWRIWQQI